MAHYEIVDSTFVFRVQVLDLVKHFESCNIQTIGYNYFRFTSEEVFAFPGGYTADCGKDMCTVGSGPFNIYNSPHIEKIGFLFPVVKFEMFIKLVVVHGQISTQEGCMCGKHCFDIQVVATNSRDRQSGHPLMEMGDDSLFASSQFAHNSEKFLDLETERGNLVQQLVILRNGNVVVFPNEVFNFSQTVVDRKRIEKHNPWPTGNNPLSIIDFVSHFPHSDHRLAHGT